MIRVLVVDDHAVVREGLKRIIKDAPGMSVAGEAADGKEALMWINKQSWDVVVLDISMPGSNGLEVLKEIKRERPELPVLMLSMHGEDQYAVRALKAGASGYITKESAANQLIEAILRVTSGRKYISPALAEQLAEDVTRDMQQPHTALSDREYEVLCLLANGNTVTEIAEELSLSAKTISTYRARILEKMGMENNAQLMHYALKHRLV